MNLKSDTPISTDLTAPAMSHRRAAPIRITPNSPLDRRQKNRKNRRGRSRFEVPQVFVLVVMLLLVIYAMHEAGKPENWEWMGFKDPNAQANLESTSQPDEPLGPSSSSPAQFRAIDNLAGSESSSPQASEETPTEPLSVAADLETISSAIQATTTATKPTGPTSEIAAEFWRSIINKMRSEQQSTFLKMLRSMRHGEPIAPETVEACRSLVSIISKNRDKFHRELFDQLALTTDGTQEKKEFSTRLFDSQAVWDKEILPALQATVQGEDFTLAQLQAIHQLQATIDPVLYDLVQDKTAIGWAGDSSAWKRIWEIASGKSAGAFDLNEPPPNFEPVTRIELMSQPKFYRGQPIKVEGWVRSARESEVAKNSELGISKKYTMWIRPKETKLGPYCVYTHELPEEFPELTDQFQDLNEQVHIEGYFFKIRTYVAADSSVITCPVIVASGLTRIAPVEHTSVHGWQPHQSTLIAAFLLMPIFATAIAWWAFRYSKTNPYQPGKKTANKINKTLGLLASDPLVQTDREKVQALYNSDLLDSDSDSVSEYQDESRDQETDLDEYE